MEQKSKNLKVSIIIPTGGGRHLELLEAIHSALDQEYKNVEVLVVSDGKNDSAETVKNIQDKRFLYIEAERWGDPVRIREIGIERSNGDALCFLDDDDILYPNHISELMPHLNFETIPFSRARYVFMEKGKPDRETLDIEPHNPSAPYYKPEHIFEQNIAPISSFLIFKKMHFEIGGFDKNLIRLEDWDYWARMSLKFKLKFIDVVTNEIHINLSKQSRTIRSDIFQGTNARVGNRIRERLLFMRNNKKVRIDEDVRKNFLIPKVSVVMPIYNAQEFLDEAIQSILGQTYTDFELLLINDGSADKSKEIIERYRSDKRVKIFHKKNEGITRTLNFGLSKSIGRYIARMDADDISMKNRLELQVKFLDEHKDVGLLGSRFTAITVDKRFIENLDVELENDDLQEALIKSCRFGHPTVMMRRSALEMVGVYDESNWANTVEDYDLWLRISEKYKVANLPQYLLKYRVNPKSITQTKKEINQQGTKECIARAIQRRAILRPSLVSICIPAYKQPELLHKTFESILCQTYKNYEVIVTDDSQDSSVKLVCGEYETKLPLLRYIKNKERKGTPENWNEAMRYARGEYIKILHHDDWFSQEDSLERFVKMLDNNRDADFAFSGSMNYDPKGILQNTHKISNRCAKRMQEDATYLFAGNFVGAPSATIFRRSVNLFFDTQFKWVVDIDFYIQLLKKNGHFVYTRDPLVSIQMQSPNQVTAICINNKEIQIREYLVLYQKILKRHSVRPYQFEYIWKLFDRFCIKTEKDIQECGFQDRIPIELKAILFFQQSRFIRAPLRLWQKGTNYIYLLLRRGVLIFAFGFVSLLKFFGKK